MLQVELKKILFHHKGLLLLLIALAAYAVFCVGSGYDSSYVIDRNEDTYLAYMDRWQGEVTEEKAQEMEAEYAEATRSDGGRKAAFLTIYNQYYYAKEDPAHRFLMDERGWDTLLTHEGVNVILLLFLLALCVPVFCGEYQCGMAIPVWDGADPPLLQKWPRAAGWNQIRCNGGPGGSGDGFVSVGAVCCCLLVGRPGWSILSAAKPVLF